MDNKKEIVPGSVDYKGWAFFAILYTAAVLTIDTLATQRSTWLLDWKAFHWWTAQIAQWCEVHQWNESYYLWLRAPFFRLFDLYKFIMWFYLPFIVSMWWMDWGWFGVKRWKKVDLYILVGLCAICLLALFLIPYVPGLKSSYPGMKHLPYSAKISFVLITTGWTLSWILGWEFLHRYVLLRQVDGAWPRFGWLLVPLSEGIYHLQKDPLEMLGMVALSLVLTAWAKQRKNLVLPFLVHFTIEMGLMLFRLLY